MAAIDRQKFDVIIAGAGPAGSSAAIILGQAGKKTLLLDKSNFPRDKTCGDGLTFKCIEPLRRLGALERFMEKVQFYSHGYSLFFSDYSELTVRRVMNEAEYFVYVLPRFVFDNLLLQRALEFSTVTFMPSITVESVIKNNYGITGVNASGHGESHQFIAPLVIDATGVNSTLAVAAGAGNQDSHRCAVAIRGYYENIADLQNTVEFYFDEAILPGYYWIFPTSPTTANIGCGTFQHIIDERKLDLRNLMDSFFTNHPMAKEKLKNATLCGKLSGGKIPLAIEYQNSRVRDGLILTGDAASFTDPVTAEGISYAMTSGILAAETAIDAMDKNNFSFQQLSAYDHLWKTRFNRQFSKAPFLTTLLSADIFADYLSKSFRENDRALRSVGKLAQQYELMFKLKALMKAI